MSRKKQELLLPLLLHPRTNRDLIAKRHLYYQICMEEIAELRESILSKRYFSKTSTTSTSVVVLDRDHCLPTYLPEIDIKYRYAEHDEPTNETRAQTD